MTTTFLDDADVERLTKRTRLAAQRRALDRMGVRYLTRPDGRPIVPRVAIERLYEPAPAAPPQPNWSAL